MLRTLALVAALALAQDAPAPPAPAPTPTFVPGDPARLTAKLVKAKEVIKRKPGALLEIQVTNRSDQAAEPVAFRITPRKKGSEPFVVLRMLLPSYGRAGRVVLPGKKLTYPVLAPVEAALLKKADVEVIDASFVEGIELLEGWDEPPALEVSKPKTESRFRQEWQATFDHTVAELRNLTEHDLDLVFEAKFTGRFKGQGLVFASVPARDRAEVVWDWIPTERTEVGATYGARGFQGAEFSKLELVDWSARLDDGADLAAELLAAAWDRRAELDEEHLAWTAACRVTLVGHNRLEDVACRLGFDDRGGWRLVDDGDLDAGGRSELLKFLRDLLQPTALRELPDVGPDLSVERLGPRTLLAHRDGSDRKRHVGLERDAIASRGREVWTTRDVDEGWLLEAMTFTNGASVTEFAWTWTRVDGQWFPATVSLQGPPGGGALWPERLVLELSDWSR